MGVVISDRITGERNREERKEWERRVYSKREA